MNNIYSKIINIQHFGLIKPHQFICIDDGIDNILPCYKVYSPYNTQVVYINPDDISDVPNGWFKCNECVNNEDEWWVNPKQISHISFREYNYRVNNMILVWCGNLAIAIANKYLDKFISN